ncbi:SipW-dependent-type signal peptide-containing protein [Georgenia sp. Z1491]|uniref:SipW-dependent-type signal peptide-containing protein n=1 Tax=Georgenia sp. Z1491 TaxID=3416707 RepID=UPI003CEA0C0C
MSAATTTHSRPRPHLVRALVAALVAVVAVVVLQPSGGTTAAWSDSVEVSAPTGTTGSLSLAVTGGVTGSAVVTPGGTAASTWAPTSVTVTAGGVPLTGTQLAGSRIEYRTAGGTSCTVSGAPLFSATPTAAGTSFPVTGGAALSGTQTLCVTLVPGDTLRASHAGVSLAVTTAITATQAGDGTWTAAQSWSTTQDVPAALPALPEVGSLDSRPHTNGKWIHLDWTWADSASGAPSTAPVAEWRVEYRVATSNWQPMLRTSISGTARTVEIRWQDIRSEFTRSGSTGWLRVVAVLPDGSAVASTQIAVTISPQHGGTITRR